MSEKIEVRCGNRSCFIQFAKWDASRSVGVIQVRDEDDNWYTVESDGLAVNEQIDAVFADLMHRVARQRRRLLPDSLVLRNSDALAPRRSALAYQKSRHAGEARATLALLMVLAILGILDQAEKHACRSQHPFSETVEEACSKCVVRP